MHCVLTLPILAILCAFAGPIASVDQAVDMGPSGGGHPRGGGAQMPNVSFNRGGELAGRADGTGISLTWSEYGKNLLHVSRRLHSSAEEAIRQLRDMRLTISAGVPQPLPGVADEAYYPKTYGWHTYFARGRFVCQVGGRNEDPTRRLTDIVVKHIDSSVHEKRKIP